VCQEQLSGRRCSPTRGSRRRSLTGSLIERTSSTPATRAGASVTASNARPRNELDPPTRRARADRRLPVALPAPARRRTARWHHTRQSGNINTNHNRRQVGPLQAIAPGPVQAIVSTRATTPRGACKPVRFGLSANSSSCVAPPILARFCAASCRTKVLELVAPVHSRLIADGSRNWRRAGGCPAARGCPAFPTTRALLGSRSRS
jgi:hypothetical protein